MKELLLCVFVMSIIVSITAIICFTVRLIIYNKQLSTRNYDMESVLDRWANAEKQFQKNEKMKITNINQESILKTDEELEKEKCELLGIIQGKAKVIQELEKELNSMLVNKNQQFAKAKELIEEFSSSLSVVGECEEEECELLNRAEQFLKESK